MWPLSFVAHFYVKQEMWHLFCWFAVQAMIWSMYLIRYPPGNLFFVLWVLSDVKRHAVYFYTQALRDVPSVSTQEAIALFWEDLYEKIFFQCFKQNFLLEKERENEITISHWPEYLHHVNILII